MRFIMNPLAISPFVGVLSLALTAPLTVISSSQDVLATEQQSDAAQDAIKQIALTAPQIEAFLSAQKPIAAILDKLSDAESENPSPKVIAQLDAVAKTYKFANYAEYQDVADNIDLVIAGIDPQTKKYVGAEVVIKQQIAEVEADKTLSAKDRKEQLDELNESLKSLEPIKFPGNIDLVLKYYDKLAQAMQQDDQ
ncbi:MAG: hypothetical protein WCF20_13235 [Methylovirgula sp.]